MGNLRRVSDTLLRPRIDNERLVLLVDHALYAMCNSYEYRYPFIRLQRRNKAYPDKRLLNVEDAA